MEPGLSPARPRPSQTGSRSGRGRETQAEPRAACPDSGSFAVPLPWEALVRALAGKRGGGNGGKREKEST